MEPCYSTSLKCVHPILIDFLHSMSCTSTAIHYNVGIPLCNHVHVLDNIPQSYYYVICGHYHASHAGLSATTAQFNLIIMHNTRVAYFANLQQGRALKRSLIALNEYALPCIPEI